MSLSRQDLFLTCGISGRSTVGRQSTAANKLREHENRRLHKPSEHREERGRLCSGSFTEELESVAIVRLIGYDER